MNTKTIAIKTIGLIANPITKLQLQVSNKIINMNYNEACSKLNNIRDNRNCNIKCSNKLNPIYDLMIVIPAYNCKEYIKKCLYSILEQKTKYAFQIVIIDDGSNDGTEKIVDEFKINKNIKVIHQKNQGIACARNQGLKEITGNYIMFVDSDDILYPNAIENLLEKAYNLKADIVEGGNTCLIGEKIITVNQYKNTTEENNSKHRGMPWGRVIRSELFKNIQFPSGFEYEDSIFAYYIIPISKRKYNISDIVYGYRINDKSISHTATKTITCIDTYYISTYLWEFYAKNFKITEAFNIQVLNQIALNYRRTRFQKEEILKSGLIFQRESYMKIFSENENDEKLKQKYEQLDNAIKTKDWAKYNIICKRWKFLK